MAEQYSIPTIEKITVDDNIVNLFFDAAEKYPGNLAIVEKDTQISFANLKKQVENTAAFLQSKGIEKGDRVLVFVPMSIDLYRIVLAIFQVGATAVFLDEWVNKSRLEKCCEIAHCKAFIGGFKMRALAVFSAALRKIPVKLGLSYDHLSPRQFLPAKVNKSDTALITFTTGSTGTPKAAKRTHGFLQEQFSALLEKINPQPNDVDMPMLPIVLLINLAVGCTSVIANFNARKPESLQEEVVIGQIKKHRVNRLVASPFVVSRLAKYVIRHQIDLSTLEKIFTGGAPVFPAEAKVFDKAFPTAKIEVIYGSTEAEPISSIGVKNLLSENVLQQGLNVGIPYRQTKVKIIKINDQPIACATENDLQQLELPVGAIGEIIVSGPHVLDAYFNNEKALLRSKIFIGTTCWHRTDDSGYLDENGTLFLTGRCGTLIFSEGALLTPFIFENHFQSLAGVAIGTILEIENKIVAVIELQNRKEEALFYPRIMACNSKIEEVIFVKKMPRDSRHHSKIDYGKLRRLLG